MLEVTPVGAAVVRCFGTRGALDHLPVLAGAVARIAPDELWVIGPASAKAELADRAGAWVSSADPDGMAIDQSDGWTAWTVSGTGAATLFARLSAMPLPAGPLGLAQGALAEVPAKVLVEDDRWHLFVPAQYGHVIQPRIERAGADLELRWGEPRELVLDRALPRDAA